MRALLQASEVWWYDCGCNDSMWRASIFVGPSFSSESGKANYSFISQALNYKLTDIDASLEHGIRVCCIPSMSLPIRSSVGISPQYFAGVVYHQVEDWLAVRGCGPTAIATTTDECHSRAPLLPPLASLSLFPLSFSCLFREMPQLGVGLLWQIKINKHFP